MCDPDTRHDREQLTGTVVDALLTADSLALDNLHADWARRSVAEHVAAHVLHDLAREEARQAGAAKALTEAAEIADSVIVSWQGVAGLHPEAPEPHPAAIAAAGARRTLVVLRRRMTEAFRAALRSTTPDETETTDVQ